jgi:hypothetical protein
MLFGNLVHIAVKNKDINAEYLGITRMWIERKNVAEAERAMLEKIRNAERFQHEAIQWGKTTHEQLIRYLVYRFNREFRRI